MIRTVFTQKDATIYEDAGFRTLNTGLDEILELRNALYSITLGNIAETVVTASSLSRILLKFDLTDISSSISSGQITNPKYYLKLNASALQSLALDYTIEAYPISQSWTNGTGKKASNPIINDGASWDYKTSGSIWSGSSATPIGGATWFTQSAYAATKAFSYNSATNDVDMDVSNIVNAWVSGSLTNEGFILKFTDAIETSGLQYGALNFFSRDTNTIYPPTLQVRWNDSSFSTGSLTAVDINSMNISVNGLKDRYKLDEIAKITLHTRDRFPAKAFVTSSRYLTSKFIPSCSFYSVKDAHTEETLISFDTGSTKISCNSSGNYFNFDMSGLQPERYYKFVLKVQDSASNPSNVVILDNKFYFKVER